MILNRKTSTWKGILNPQEIEKILKLKFQLLLAFFSELRVVPSSYRIKSGTTKRVRVFALDYKLGPLKFKISIDKFKA
jgi:hypothetical protein